MADHAAPEGPKEGTLTFKVDFRYLSRPNVQILAMDDGTFPALLKTLSDSSEEVHDILITSATSFCTDLFSRL